MRELEVAAEPYEARITDMQSTIVRLEAEKAAIQADVQRWKDRNAALLSRYDQVDPEVHRELQNQLNEANSTLESLQAAKSELESKVAEYESKVADLEAQLAKASQGQAGLENLRVRHVCCPGCVTRNRVRQKSALFNLQTVNQLKKELSMRPDPEAVASKNEASARTIKALRDLCSRFRAALEARGSANDRINADTLARLDTANQQVWPLRFHITVPDLMGHLPI